MKNLLATLCFFAFTVVCFSQTPIAETTTKNKISQLIEKAISEKKCVGMAAGISVDGKIAQTGAGLRDSEKNLPFLPETSARTASIAKPITAIAIMQLVEQGKVDLDAPIQKYIADFPIKKEGAITVRHLLSHSSGMNGYRNNKDRNNKKNFATMAAAVDNVEDRKLIATPGEEFNYTSYGYTVLGLVIEHASGMSFDAYLQKNILDKVGMKNTGIEYADQNIEGKAAIYHRNNKGKIKTCKPTNLTDRIPGGGIFSSVEDLLKFGDALLNNSLVSAETLALMSTDTGLKKEGNPYGFGWYLYGGYFGSLNPQLANVFGHNGGQLGTSSILLLMPDQNASVVVISNTSGALQEVFDISFQLINGVAKAKESDSGF